MTGREAARRHRTVLGLTVAYWVGTTLAVVVGLLAVVALGGHVVAVVLYVILVMLAAAALVIRLAVRSDLPGSAVTAKSDNGSTAGPEDRGSP